MIGKGVVVVVVEAGVIKNNIMETTRDAVLLIRIFPLYPLSTKC